VERWRVEAEEGMRKLVLLAFTLFLLFPMYWLFTGSLKDAPGMFRTPPQLWPHHVTLANYAKTLQTQGLALAALNTMIVVAIAVAGNVFVSFTGGWYLAMHPGWLSRAIVVLLLVAMMAPRQTLLIPMFVEFRRFGLIGTHLGAAMPLWLTPVTVLFCRNWLKAAPKVYWEDAQTMGASGWTLMRHVIIPLATPVLGFIVLITGTGALSDYLWQSLILQTDNLHTMYVTLMTSIQMASFERWPNIQGWRLAISVVMLVPMLIVGLASQSQFADNVARGIAE
jgi:multiple sugar transport system permease protein